MKESVKKLWIKALLSGEYKQGTGYLRKRTIEGKVEYCCLGVLCDLHMKRMKKEGWKSKYIADYDYEASFAYKGETDSLPEEVMKWAGIETTAGEYKPKTEYEDASLAIDNDSGKTFKQIAKIIDKKF